MVLTIIGVILAFYLGLTLLLFVFQERFIYFPTRTITTTPAAIGLDYEAVQLETADGLKLSGWFVPAENANDVLLFFHGNAGNISHRLASIEQFHRLGLNVFIIDYRGYGQSEGRPTEAGTYLDAEAAWRYLIETKGYRPEQIILFGRSLGGAVATWLAQQHPPRALILESTFTSVPDMGVRQFPFLPVRALARIGYNTQARLPHIQTPVLIVHSPDDEVIPYSHGQQLYQDANEPKEFLQLRGGHNEGFIISTNYEADIKSFLQAYSEGK
jgi:hypothetical protein